MRPFEYALALFSILFGLALADVVMSFHRLVRSERPVRWDGRVFAAALLVVVEIVRVWFAQWTIRSLDVAVTFPIVGAKFTETLLLVLLAMAALPDERIEAIDLTAFYDRNRRYFWGIFSAYQALYATLWVCLFKGSLTSVATAPGPLDWARVFGPLALYLALTFLRNRILDYAAPLALTLFYLVLYRSQSLAG